MKLTTLIYCLILFCASCASIKDVEISKQLAASKCNQQNLYSYSTADFPKPLNELYIHTKIQNSISAPSLHIANTIGIIDYLNAYAELKTSQSSEENIENRLKILELKQAIDHQINNASLVISAVSSELDCEEERVSQIAHYISEKQGTQESKLTIGAIVLGATGAILTGGVIKNDKASNAVGISTGIAEAGLGLTMLFNKRKIDFYHERNILQDIWEGPAVSKLFPSFIWYYLNSEDINKNSLRKDIIDKWSQFGQIDENSKDIADLYFGKGGKYTVDDLENRADMYDQLESQIYLLKQKLMTLAQEIDEIK
ncbi:MAG: hypothetical protein ACI35V_09750 [Sphingobacterium composti]|uniref:hypothetical protein n=1 Tax=Sphingobacterium composti TaxID=363260 RepID=UPI00135924FB|nr:hypothetical protein [Sphingobacterium composti Ten et al. 2007 non Yoo et al. 2007]